MKRIILIIFLSITTASAKDDNMFIFYTAFWSGCTQSINVNLGKTYGHASDFCKAEAQKMSFGFIPYSEEEKIIEKSTSIFYNGCITGFGNTNKCEHLTKQFNLDLNDIIMKQASL